MPPWTVAGGVNHGIGAVFGQQAANGWFFREASQQKLMVRYLLGAGEDRLQIKPVSTVAVRAQSYRREKNSRILDLFFPSIFLFLPSTLSSFLLSLSHPTTAPLHSSLVPDHHFPSPFSFDSQELQFSLNTFTMADDVSSWPLPRCRCVRLFFGHKNTTPHCASCPTKHQPTLAAQPPPTAVLRARLLRAIIC